jgi:histone deacetylase 11
MFAKISNRAKEVEPTKHFLAGASHEPLITYLRALMSAFPDAIGTCQPALVVYNAGTDILAGDPLGDLGVSAEGIIARDRYVIDTCADRTLPLLIVPSGGYTEFSHRLITEMLQHVLRQVDQTGNT